MPRLDGSEFADFMSEHQSAGTNYRRKRHRRTASEIAEDLRAELEYLKAQQSDVDPGPSEPCQGEIDDSEWRGVVENTPRPVLVRCVRPIQAKRRVWGRGW